MNDYSMILDLWFFFHLFSAVYRAVERETPRVEWFQVKTGEFGMISLRLQHGGGEAVHNKTV